MSLGSVLASKCSDVAITVTTSTTPPNLRSPTALRGACPRRRRCGRCSSRRALALKAASPLKRFASARSRIRASHRDCGAVWISGASIRLWRALSARRGLFRRCRSEEMPPNMARCACTTHQTVSDRAGKLDGGGGGQRLH